MNRRNFLASLFATSVVSAAAPKYFFAPPGGWTLNQSIYTFGNVKGTLTPFLGHELDAFAYSHFLFASLDGLDPQLNEPLISLTWARFPGESDAHLRQRIREVILP